MGADLCLVRCLMVSLHARHSVQYCAGHAHAGPRCFHAQTALKGLHATAPSILLFSQVQGGAAGLPGFETGLPMFVGGISLGGCIAFNAALADREAGCGLFRCVDGGRGGRGGGGGAGLGAGWTAARWVEVQGVCVWSRGVWPLLNCCQTVPAFTARRGAVLLAPMLSLEKVSRKVRKSWCCWSSEF